MLEEKVFVAVFFKRRIISCAKRCQCFFVHTVKVDAVILKAIIRCEVHAAAKPPDIFLTCVLGFGNKEAYIHMHRRHVRVVRVKHQRDPHGFPRSASCFRVGDTGCRRQFVAEYVRKTNASALKHVAAFQQARVATTAFRPLPAVLQEGFTVDQFYGFDDACLQALQVIVNGSGLDLVSHHDLVLDGAVANVFTVLCAVELDLLQNLISLLLRKLHGFT